MEILLTTFAAEVESSGGLSALGLNLQSFLFQLITFVLVLLLLRKFVYTKLVDTLEERRKVVIESLDNAKKAADDLEKMNDRTAVLLEKAKKDAADIVLLAQKEAAGLVDEADTKAKKRADHLIETAESQLALGITKARQDLKSEMLSLVSEATEKILKQKLDSTSDKKLIKDALQEMK